MSSIFLTFPLSLYKCRVLGDIYRLSGLQRSGRNRGFFVTMSTKGVKLSSAAPSKHLPGTADQVVVPGSLDFLSGEQLPSLFSVVCPCYVDLFFSLFQCLIGFL